MVSSSKLPLLSSGKQKQKRGYQANSNTEEIEFVTIWDVVSRREEQKER